MITDTAYANDLAIITDHVENVTDMSLGYCATLTR